MIINWAPVWLWWFHAFVWSRCSIEIGFGWNIKKNLRIGRFHNSYILKEQEILMLDAYFFIFKYSSYDFYENRPKKFSRKITIQRFWYLIVNFDPVFVWWLQCDIFQYYFQAFRGCIKFRRTFVWPRDSFEIELRLNSRNRSRKS